MTESISMEVSFEGIEAKRLNAIKFSAVSLLTAMRDQSKSCLLYTSPSPRDKRQSRMPSSA